MYLAPEARLNPLLAVPGAMERANGGGLAGPDNAWVRKYVNKVSAKSISVNCFLRHSILERLIKQMASGEANSQTRLSRPRCVYHVW